MWNPKKEESEPETEALGSSQEIPTMQPQASRKNFHVYSDQGVTCPFAKNAASEHPDHSDGVSEPMPRKYSKIFYDWKDRIKSSDHKREAERVVREALENCVLKWKRKDKLSLKPWPTCRVRQCKQVEDKCKAEFVEEIKMLAAQHKQLLSQTKRQ